MNIHEKDTIELSLCQYAPHNSTNPVNIPSGEAVRSKRKKKCVLTVGFGMVGISKSLQIKKLEGCAGKWLILKTQFRK